MELYNVSSTKGNYDTDLSNIREGVVFPSREVRRRNKQYKWNMKLFNGEYAKNKQLVALVDGSYQHIDYKILPLNYFELVVNKLYGLLCGKEITVTTGDIHRDKEINRLIERTSWMSSVHRAIKYVEIYGDVILKTGRFGVSVCSPRFGYKVVDISDKDKVKAYVLREVLYTRQDNVYKPTHIRIIIACKGFEFERVYEYNGSNDYGTLGKPVRYKYKDRWIPRKGRYYYTDVEDCETVQWLSVNKEKDGVYGSASFDNIKELVFALEARISTENWVIDAHGKPILLVGMSSIKTNETTGEYELSIINGKYMIDRGGTEAKPQYLTWDGKLSESKQVREDLKEAFYELSELGRTFLSGEYSGQVSEETIANIIKSAIDRANREVNDIWYEIRKSLYVLCQLNNIDVALEDINIDFNVGRVDDVKVIADICKVFIDLNMFSRQTLLNKYFGYTEDAALAEFERIKSEHGGLGNDTVRITE